VKIADLMKPHILELEAYPPGKPVEELERELGISGSIKLASNESPLGPSRRALEAAVQATEGLNRYPDGSSYYLREALASQLGVAPEALIFGTGSSELLEILAKCVLGPGDEAVFPWPSFAMYPIVTRGMGAKPVEVALDGDFRFDVASVLSAVTDRTRVVFLANPNNPTGTSIGQAEFDVLVDGLPERVILVHDEAYLDYVRRDDFPDTLAAIRRRPTVLSLRTFSKVYGLAGLRVGYAIGDPELVGYLERARHPFNVNSMAQAAALGALRDAYHLARVRELTHRGLEKLERAFDELGLAWARSDANYVLVEVGEDAAGLYQRLLRRGVITRALGAFGLSSHLRVTVGLPEENDRFIEALRAELGR
jgi:histidinol-phosphate aminotransferase